MKSTTAVARRLVGLLPLLVLGLSAPAARADDGDGAGRPWFPMIDPRAPGETYDLNELSVIRVGADDWRVNRGKYRESVSRHDFFVTIGRGDLAQRETSARATSGAILWCGVTAMGIGTWMLYAHFSPGGLDPSPAWGLGLLAGGGVAALVSGHIDGPSLSQDEVDGMARRYNDQLRTHIEEEDGQRPPSRIQAHLELPRLAPWTDGRSGLGLLAVGRF